MANWLLEFMKIKLFLILLLAAVLRFYQLGQVPSGFINDEAAFGYNAYSLLKTGRDEFGKAWPIIFHSFGEGKLPAYIYLTMPSVAIFGLNEFAVRLPSAIFGVLTVLVVSRWSLVAGLVLATMPWHIHFSRAAFEANAALFLVTWGTWWWYAKKRKLSLTSFILTIFTYNAARLFTPLWFGWLAWRQRQTKLFLVFLGFWAALMFLPQSRQRLAGTTIFQTQSGVDQRLEQKFAETRNQPLWLTRALHNKPVEYGLDFFRRYSSHFSPEFLFFSGDPIRPRYRVPDMGQLLWLELPFLLIGLYLTIKKRQWWILLWLGLAPLPAAITFETPSAIRSYLMIVPLAIIIAYGVSTAWQKLRLLGQVFLILLFSYNLIHYLDAYFIHAPVHQPYEWQGGYKELVQRVNQLMPNYEKALITDSRGTAYIYFLFYNQYDPAKWQAQSKSALTAPDKFGFTSINHLDNLYFISKTCPVKNPESGTLYVCTQEDHPQFGFNHYKEKTIFFDNGEPAFDFFELEKIVNNIIK